MKKMKKKKIKKKEKVKKREKGRSIIKLKDGLGTGKAWVHSLCPCYCSFKFEENK